MPPARLGCLASTLFSSLLYIMFVYGATAFFTVCTQTGERAIMSGDTRVTDLGPVDEPCALAASSLGSSSPAHRPQVTETSGYHPEIPGAIRLFCLLCLRQHRDQ